MCSIDKKQRVSPGRRVTRDLLSRLRTSVSALVLLTAGWSGHSTADAAPPELRTSGNKIVIKSNNQAVRLTGVSTPSLEWNLNGENLANSIPYAISDWHAKIIRLPVSQASWLSATNGPAYKARVDGFIAQASDAGTYVILDLHQYGQPTTGATTFWTDAATRYANNPAVIFGLFNEPHGITWDVWKNGNASGPGLQALLNTVRATGALNMVLVGGLDWAYDLSGILNGYALTDTTGNGIIYDTHFYPWKGSWQSKVGNVAQIHPVLAGEFGHPGGTTFIGLTFETHTTWVPKALDWVDAHQLHYTAWSFHPGAAPCLISDWGFTPTTFWGEPALQRLQGYQNPSSDKVAGGTVIGTPGTRSAPNSGVITDASWGAVSPFNGSYTSYFDAATASGAWTGLDLGTAKRITKIRFVPRQNNGALMVGGVFQGSNSADFSSGVTTLHTVTTAPVATGGAYTTATVSSTASFRYVRYMGPANSHCNVALILFYTGDGIGNTTPVDDTISDNVAAPGNIRTGTWTSSTATAGYHGSNYWHDGNTGKGTKSVRYTPNLPVSGYYEVFVRYTSGTNRASNVPIDIIHGAGIARVSLDQRTGGGQWVSLGLHSFFAGTSGSVIIGNAGTDGFVIADAIRFVRKSLVIMDNSAFSGVTLSGSWTKSTATPGYLGSNFIHDGGTEKGLKSVLYTPTLPTSGTYEVFARWTAASNRAASVPIDITHNGGTSTVNVDQRSNGGQWMSLGSYIFNSGTTGNLRIRNEGTSGIVVADGVRFYGQ